MILTALLGLAIQLVTAAILYCLGKILSDYTQLRKFLGLQTPDEQESDFERTAYWVENIGKLVIIMAILDAIIAPVTTIAIIWNMF